MFRGFLPAFRRCVRSGSLKNEEVMTCVEQQHHEGWNLEIVYRPVGETFPKRILGVRAMRMRGGCCVKGQVS
jgi:hypothetical protein